MKSDLNTKVVSCNPCSSSTSLIIRWPDFKRKIAQVSSKYLWAEPFNLHGTYHLALTLGMYSTLPLKVHMSFLAKTILS